MHEMRLWRNVEHWYDEYDKEFILKIYLDKNEKRAVMMVEWRDDKGGSEFIRGCWEMNRYKEYF